MKREFKGNDGLAPRRKEDSERLWLFFPRAAHDALQFFSSSSLRFFEKAMLVLCLAGLALLSACVTSGTVSGHPGTAVQKHESSVARLDDGRQGFVIREKPNMDSDSRREFERAVALMNEGKNDEAVELLTKVIERAPGVTAPYINIAVAYLRIGKPEPAEQHLKTALELVPNHPVASNEYGLLLRKAGRFNEARELYEMALANFPDYLVLHKNLGILCDLYLNDPECALKQFETYSEGMPGDAKVKIWISELRIRTGKN